jgi:hypothetical protein
MLNHDIFVALDHSPKHKHAIAHAVLQAGASKNVKAAGAVVRDKCDHYQILDFPNPFKGKDKKKAKLWDEGFFAKDEEAPPAGTPVDPLPGEKISPDAPDISKMTKKVLDEYAQKEHAITLDRRKTLPVMQKAFYEAFKAKAE